MPKQYKALHNRLSRAEQSLAVSTARLEQQTEPHVNTTYGIVDMNLNVIRCYQVNTTSQLLEPIPVTGSPDMLIAEKLEPLLTIPKKRKIIYGGRAGMKTITAQGLILSDAKDNGGSTMAFRQVQKSIEGSIYRGFKKEMVRLGLKGFRAIKSKLEIVGPQGSLISMWGLGGDILDIKGLTAYKRFWIEEAAKTAQEVLDVMGPTLREVPGAEIWYSLNPESSQDAIYSGYIKPYLKQLNRDGIYEDEHVLVIKVLYTDNPWFKYDNTLTSELKADQDAVAGGIKKQKKFDNIWLGETLDTVDNAIIFEEWFDAAIDAHLVLGVQVEGPVICSFDPADNQDAKAYVARRGPLIFEAMQRFSGDVHDARHWATENAINSLCDHFVFDYGGLGRALLAPINTAFRGKHVKVYPFDGQGTPDQPGHLYQKPATNEKGKPKTNKETFFNKRAQFSIRLADRFLNTYRAVVLKDRTISPDSMIFISSECKDLDQFKAETCKIPTKHNALDKIQIMTKEEMARKPLCLPSPNLYDAAMMSMIEPEPEINTAPAAVPRTQPYRR